MGENRNQALNIASITMNTCEKCVTNDISISIV